MIFRKWDYLVVEGAVQWWCPMDRVSVAVTVWWTVCLVGNCTVRFAQSVWCTDYSVSDAKTVWSTDCLLNTVRLAQSVWWTVCLVEEDCLAHHYNSHFLLCFCFTNRVHYRLKSYPTPTTTIGCALVCLFSTVYFQILRNTTIGCGLSSCCSVFSSNRDFKGQLLYYWTTLINLFFVPTLFATRITARMNSVVKAGLFRCLDVVNQL